MAIVHKSDAQNENVTGASGDSRSESPIPSTSSGHANGVNTVGGAHGMINLRIPSDFSGILHINRHHAVQNTEELQIEGRELFIDFLQDEFQHDNVQVPTNIQQFVSQDHPQSPPKDMKQHGKELRHLADEFAKSEGRKRVRKEADKVMSHIDTVTAEEFREFLGELFVDNKNPWERVVTLFYFCRDIIIAAAQKKMFEITKNIFKWSVDFILQKVCDFVAKYGGWSAVLGSMTVVGSIYWFGIFAIASLVIAGGFYFWKNK